MFSLDLQENEKLLKLYRETDLTLIKPCSIVLLAIYLPIWFLFRYELLGKFIPLLTLWTVIVLVYALNKFLLWLINVNIITNKRVIVVTYKHLMSREIEDMHLTGIHNIKSSHKGILANIFHFGDVELQTQAGGLGLVFHNVREPEKVKNLLWKVVEKFSHPSIQPSSAGQVVQKQAKIRKIV